LLLDLDRVEAPDSGEVTAHARLALDWDKDSLDQLLALADGDEIGLLFDERELARAFDDVEAHGLRQRAAVVAVAVAAAGASATPALARVAEGAGIPSGGQSTAAAVQPRAGGPMGAVRGEQLDEQIAVPGGGQSAGFSVDPQAGGSGARAQAAGAERALLQDEQLAVDQTQGTGVESPAVTSTGGGGMSSGEIAAIAGAGAVLISAAGFGIARKHTPPAQPA
jgi:hypothetical protein